MMPRTPEIGFSSQKLRYAWVQHTASLALAGISGKILTAELDQRLAATLSGAAASGRGSRQRAITILKRIWARDTAELRPFREEGYEFLRTLPAGQQLAVHWGMTIAMYPFWDAVARAAGRLLRLQGSILTVQVQRRMKESYGDREIVVRATCNILRSFVDWGVLLETDSRGVYSAGEPLTIDDARLIAWLSEAQIHARRDKSAPLQDLLDSPAMFSFRMRAVNPESLLVASSRLDILRHGLDDTLVLLRVPETS